MFRKFLYINFLLISFHALGQPAISGKFALIDHHGQQVTQQSYEGKLRLVFFGYTSCPSVCPMTMMEITQVMKDLDGKASDVQPLFITINPNYDNVSILSAYVRNFHPSIVGLTGDRQQISAAAKAFKTSFGGTSAAEKGQQDGDIFHSAYVYLMDRDGNFIDLFGYGTDADHITSTIMKYL